jgi:hypothetical protein
MLQEWVIQKDLSRERTLSNRRTVPVVVRRILVPNKLPVAQTLEKQKEYKKSILLVQVCWNIMLDRPVGSPSVPRSSIVQTFLEFSKTSKRHVRNMPHAPELLLASWRICRIWDRRELWA